MIYSDGTFTMSGGRPITAGQNIRALVRKNGDNLRLYVNGELVDEITASIASRDSTSITIGAGNGAGNKSRFFNGGIWNIQFYDSSLAHEECRQLTEDGKPIGVPVRMYPMADRGQSAIARNVTSTSGHMILFNSALSFFDREQSEFHYHLNYGFRKSGAVFIPALLDGVIAADGNAVTNHTGGHNAAETRIDFAPVTSPESVKNYLGYADFNGSNSDVYIPINYDYSSDAFELEFSVRLDSTASAPIFFAQTDGAGVGRSWLYRESTSGQWSTFIGGSATNFTSIPISQPNIDYKVKISRIGNSMTLTVNGLSQTRTIPSMESASGGFRLGLHKSNGTNRLNGKMSNVVLTHITHGFSLPLCKNTLDSSGNNNHGVNNGVVFPTISLPNAYPFGGTLPEGMSKQSTSSIREEKFTINSEC